MTEPKKPKQKRREPSAYEARAFPAAHEKVRAFKQPATVNVTDKNAIDSPHNDVEGYTSLVAAAVGSRSEDWLHASLNTIINSITQPHIKAGEKTDQVRLNAALAFLTDLDPDNAVEAAIGIQMLAAHEASLDMIRRTRKAGQLDQMQAYGALATKFQRTFIAQVEALAKLRRKGEQTIRHVHVGEGGRAVFTGTINQHQGGGVSGRSNEQPHEAGTAGVPTECAALPSPDPIRDGMPLASNAEREMQASWREVPRSADRKPERL